jgi:hypothetical protein
LLHDTARKPAPKQHSKRHSTTNHKRGWE